MSNSRFKFMVVVMLILFFGVMTLLYLKADEVTKDPCSICAERYGEPVVCTLPSANPIYKHFEPNGDVYINTEP